MEEDKDEESIIHATTAVAAPSGKKRTRMTTSVSLTSLPEEVRVGAILPFLDDDSLGSFACVSHQCLEDTQDPLLPQTRVAVFEGIASHGEETTHHHNNNNNTTNDNDEYNHHYHAMNFMPSWNPYQHTFLGVLQTIHRAARNKKFHPRFTTFQLVGHAGLEKVTNRDAKPFVRHLQLKHMTHLDLSLPPSEAGPIAPCIPRLMTYIMPQLRGIDFSYTEFTSVLTMTDLAKHCPQLERITWRHGTALSGALATGRVVQTCQNLKELDLYSAAFVLDGPDSWDVTNGNRQDDKCLFFLCKDNLEKVNLQNVTFQVRQFNGALGESQSLSQLALMKFVRRAPKLKWFRSDLTPENRHRLQQERPDVTFVM